MHPGLYDFGARHYDAFLGRFVSAVYHGIQTGPEAIIYGIIIGWSIGALVGLAHGGGAALVGAEFGGALIASTAAGAIGFTPGGFGEHVLERIKGNRNFFGGPGEAPGESPDRKADVKRASSMLGLLAGSGAGVVVGTAAHELASNPGQDFPAATEIALYVAGASSFGLALLLSFILPNPKDRFAGTYNAALRKDLGLLAPAGQAP